MDSGQRRLQELGYKQELKRSMSPLGNVALCFSIISIITGITPTYNTGLRYGGPVSIVYGWIIVSIFSVCIASSLAEICSAYPTSGGLYFWSYKLGGKNWGPFVAWTTGWFNIAGMWSAVAGVSFSLALLLQITVLVATGGGHGGGYFASKYVVFCMYTGILILLGLINVLGVRWFSWLASISAFCNMVGVFVIGVFLLVLLPKQSASDVFTRFNDDNGVGIRSKPYIFLLGLLMSQYSLLGYDSAAHMSEETKSGDKSSGYGILGSVLGSIVMGAIYILPLVFTSTDVPHLLDPENDTGGYAIAQLFFDAFERHLYDGKWSFVLLLIPCGIIFFCGVFIVTAGSRMCYAFSRDGALPLSRIWHRLNEREVPLNAVIICIIMPFLFGLPYLASAVAFQATLSIATITISVAYMIPILLRVTVARHSFVPGPLNLGRFSLLIGWLSVCWIMTFSVLFCLPVAYPLTSETLNYAPVVLGGFSVFTLAYWALSGRNWFQGPVPNFEQAGI